MLKQSLKYMQKRCLKSVDQQLCLVIGNESCDLDSAASAICYATLLNDQQSSGDGDPIVAPVLNIPRQQFNCHTEVLYCLRKVLESGQKDSQTISDFLLFKDDFNFEQLFIQKRLKLILVDQNSLSPGQSNWAENVVKVIDHHHNTPQTLTKPDRIIKPVGSCSTLIAEIILEQKEQTMSQSVGFLLYGSILVDTECLEDPYKTTDLDRTIVGKIEEKFPSFDRQSIYLEILNAKGDISHLTVVETLAKDYKRVKQSDVKIGMSSVPVSIDSFLSKVGSKTSCFGQFCQIQDIDALVIRTGTDTETGCPGLIIYSDTETFGNRIREVLEKELNLQLVEYLWNVGSLNGKIMTFVQGNLAISRKQMLPALDKYNFK